MCATCGCSDDSHITMTVHGKEPLIYHRHEGTGLHSHGPKEHTHVHHEDHNHDVVHSHNKTHQGVVQLDLEQRILHSNELIAARNRGYFEALNVLTINLVSSPGSGKTTLLEKTLASLEGQLPIAVIEGDQQTSNDADRIAKFNTPVVQINTGKMCHLDAEMIREATQNLKISPESLLFIENVGNLVCPAMFDLGEAKRVVVMSVTEGTDKAIKYPEMFHTSQLCVINKIDLLPYVDFDVAQACEYARRINPQLEFIEVSAATGAGMDAWNEWLLSHRTGLD